MILFDFDPSFSDLEDIGCHIKVIGGCQHLDKETRYFFSVEECKINKDLIKGCLVFHLTLRRAWCSALMQL